MNEQDAEDVFTLGELERHGGTADIPAKAFPGYNLGNRTFELKLPMFDLYRMSQVANERGKNDEPIAQRKLDPEHAHKLAVYILRGLVSATISRMEDKKIEVPPAFLQVQERIGKQVYMSLQPIVANLRTCQRSGNNIRIQPIKTADGEVACIKFWLSQRDILWIVDGQHRRKAMDLVFQFLDDVKLTNRYPRKQSLYVAISTEVPQDELQVWMECYEVARGDCTVSVELHLGLNNEEERQLFHDLNNLAKKVESGLALEFDSANPINAFIKEELMAGGLLRVTNSDKINWSEDEGEISRKDVVAINAHLFLNKSNIHGAAPPIVRPRVAIAKQFWESVTQIPYFGENKAKEKTVAAQPVVLKALAKLTYDFAFGRNPDFDSLHKLLERMNEVDFSHSNPMWRIYEMSEQDRQDFQLNGLINYLPSEDEGKNRDLGSFDANAKFMRFGAKHNDIYPIISDMIRWRLGLPNRHNRQEQMELS